MSEPNATPSPADVRKLLSTIAELLRHAHHLSPEAQFLLADLIDELGQSFDRDEVTSAEIAHLTESASHLVQAVREDSEPGVLEGALERLRNAAVAVETESPTLAGLTRRFADLLSNIGI
jgi:proline dehydrogenase